ncbi:MAG: multidrug effflux MFS transporter [Nocardioidaceae bacterium]|nr:MAG: multidrug effflux MFS transporter [Nocardioidaceae bacterium]
MRGRAMKVGHADEADERPVPLSLLVVLAFTGATAPMAIDLYLASFPAMQRDLVTTPAMVQMTVTAYLLGMAIGQPIWGPLSDRYGRRAPLVVSNSLALVASFVVMLAPSIHIFIGARLFHAMFGAAGVVIARAMITDLARGFPAVRALALLTTMMQVVPIVAPPIGGLLATFVPWRGVLAVLTALVALQLLVTCLLVPETLSPNRRSAKLRFRRMGTVLKRPAFMVNGLAVAMATSTMLVYVASSSFVFQEVLGFSPMAFSLAFTASAMCLVAGGLLAARLARRRVNPRRTVGFALPGLIGSGLLIVVAALSPWPVLLVIPTLTNSFCANLIMSNSMAMAMQHARDMSGTGAAVIGIMTYGIGAAASPLSGVIGDGKSAVPMGIVMTAFAVLGAIIFISGRRVGGLPVHESGSAAESKGTG